MGIKEAGVYLKKMFFFTDEEECSEKADVLDVAIKSLDAWDEVLEELSSCGSIWVQYKIIDKSEKGIEKLIEDVLRQAKEQVIDIIKKHLSGVEE